jgi:hypothetical protein
MMLSTLRTETAASVASRMAQVLAANESTIPRSAAFIVPSVSALEEGGNYKMKGIQLLRMDVVF